MKIHNHLRSIYPFLLPLFAPLITVCFSELAAAMESMIHWNQPTELAKGGGVRGPWQQNESQYDYVDDPSVALNARGEAMVVWVDQSRKDVLFQRISPNGAPLHSRPLNVSQSPATFSWLPRIAFKPDAPNEISILWQEIIFSGGSHGGDILFTHSVDGGRTFAEPINLSRSIGGDGKGRINRQIWHNGSLDLAIDKEGTIFAAWTEYDGPLWFSRSTDGGKTFSTPARVVGDKVFKPARAPSLAVAPNGVVFLAWTTGDDNSADIHVAKSVDRGISWSRPRLALQTNGYSDAPKLASGPDSTLHLVFTESPGGPFTKSHIRYARSLNGDLTFGPSMEISSPAPNSVQSAGFPSLSIDARGRIYVIWELFPKVGEDPRGLGYAVSANGGQTFTLPNLIPQSVDPGGGSNGSHQGLLMRKLAVNDSGGLAVVNSSLALGENSRVWLIRGMHENRY